MGEWCDKWLAGYGTRRKSTVRQAQVHIKMLKTHFDAVPLSAVKQSLTAVAAVDRERSPAGAYGE